MFVKMPLRTGFPDTFLDKMKGYRGTNGSKGPPHDLTDQEEIALVGHLKYMAQRGVTAL